MDQGTLVREEIDAGEELVRRFDQYAPVKAAFWLKASEKPHRYLYIASDQVADTNLRAGYGEVGRLAQAMQNPYLDSFRVTLISGNHPLAQAAVDIQRRYPAHLTTRYPGITFGNLAVDDVYLYPPLVHAPVP